MASQSNRIVSYPIFRKANWGRLQQWVEKDKECNNSNNINNNNLLHTEWMHAIFEV